MNIKRILKLNRKFLKVWQKLFKSDIYNIPSSWNEFVNWVNEKDKLIPEKYRDSARIEFDYDIRHYDEVICTVEITYNRPETEQEKLERLKIEKDYKTRLKERELAELRRLRNKYGE